MGAVITYSSRAGLIAVTCDDGKIVVVDRSGRVIRTIDEAFVANLSGLIDDDRGFLGYAFGKNTANGEAGLRRVDFSTGRVADLPLRTIGWTGDIASLEFDAVANCALVAMQVAGDLVYEISVVDLALYGEEDEVVLGRPTITTQANGNEASTVGGYVDGSSRCDRSADGRLLLLVTRINPNTPGRAPFELHRIEDDGRNVVLLRSNDQYVVSARRSERGRGIILRKPPAAGLGIIHPDGGPIRWTEASNAVQWADFDVGAGTGFGARPGNETFGLIRVNCGNGDCAETVLDGSVVFAIRPTGAAVSGSGHMIGYTQIEYTPDGSIAQNLILWTEEPGPRPPSPP